MTVAKMRYRQVDSHVGRLGDAMHKSKTDNKNHSSNKHFRLRSIEVAKVKIANLRIWGQVCRTTGVVFVVLDRGEWNITWDRQDANNTEGTLTVIPIDLRQACKEVRISYFSSVHDYQAKSQQSRWFWPFYT